MKTVADLIAHGMSKLDVYVNEKAVAILSKEGRKYILSYLPDSARADDDFVSLSLPVRSESWVSEGRLHPYFEMNLPEGVRREIISMTFGKAMMSEDMAMLAVTGGDGIGRVKIVPSGFPLDWKNQCIIDIDKALSDDTGAFFASALNEFASQGVSGVQPKILVSDSRLTLKSDKWILKRDGNNLDGLSLNEFLCLSSAKNCGLSVPDSRLSADKKSLLVKRFDLEGTGFEDFCSLMGLSPVEKYSGSVERLAKVMSLVVTHDRVGAKESLLKAIIFNVCTGNADAHLKNFGVLYKDGNTTLSPMFDLVSTRAFGEFRNDIPALTIGGKKEWVIGKAFDQFATSIGISRNRVKEITKDVESGVRASMPDIADAAGMPGITEGAREMLKSMLVTWDTGLRRIHGETMNANNSSILSETGFSPIKSGVASKKNVMKPDSMKPHS
jgi:serine/threonine-protein kinase HipA